MRLRTQCRKCGYPFLATLTRETKTLSCSQCDHTLELDGGRWHKTQVDLCSICGSEHLYRQRDFNRGLGCLLVAVGAVFVPWTYGLSLVALSLIDMWLFYRLPDSVVCYRCDTVFRDARPTKRQRDFDLLKHDVLKYGKSWQELD